MNGCGRADGLLDGFRTIEVRRPQYPLILEWIDREFRVRWKNLDAASGANISCLLEDYEGEEDPEEEGGETWAQ